MKKVLIIAFVSIMGILVFFLGVGAGASGEVSAEPAPVETVTETVEVPAEVVTETVTEAAEPAPAETVTETATVEVASQACQDYVDFVRDANEELRVALEDYWNTDYASVEEEETIRRMEIIQAMIASSELGSQCQAAGSGDA